MDRYSAKVFGEARRQMFIDEAARGRLLRSGAPQRMPNRRWGVASPFRVMRRLAHVTQGS